MIRLLAVTAAVLFLAVNAEAGDCRGVVQLRAYVAAPAVEAYAQPQAAVEEQCECNAPGGLAYAASPVLRVVVPQVQYRYVAPVQQQYRVQYQQPVRVIERVRVVQQPVRVVQKVQVVERVKVVERVQFQQNNHHFQNQQFRQSRQFRNQSRRRLDGGGGGNTNIQFGLFNRAR